MSARILIVDDLEANRRMLAAKLTAEYYEVSTASRGEEAVQRAKREKPDLVLLDVMMPGMDGFEACRRLKAQVETRHIPVIIVTALDDRQSKIAGLKAGAEDFLSKPIDDVHLLARVKSLVSLKVVIDELRAREDNGRRLGVIENSSDALERHRLFSGSVLLIDDNASQVRRIKAALGVEHRVAELDDTTLFDAGPPDLAIISVSAKSFDGFRILARMRSGEPTRHLPILAIVDSEDRARALRALELGAHDILARPIDDEELIARARTLMRRKRMMEALRASLDASLELAITDQLTGLYNRRFLYAQLAPMVQRAQCGGEPVSVMTLDIDHFKHCNDAFGHDVGDAVLQEFAARIGSNVRPSDFACRQGGEEFVVIMPNTRGHIGCHAAERVRRQICASPFNVAGAPDPLEITVSIGVAASEGGDTAEGLLKRADEALYEAKRAGRNRVIGKAIKAAA
jgi:two-component system, cell cycle response regulator